MKYCPLCKGDLIHKDIDGAGRLVCSNPSCTFIHWDNPVPVVAGIVELDNKIVLAHNVSWPQGLYSVITGFLERGEDPGEAVVRETKEELNLEADSTKLIGVYAFSRMNQVIIAYHVVATGTVKLNEELDSHKLIHKEDLRPWDFGTGRAVKDYLKSLGKDAKEET